MGLLDLFTGGTQRLLSSSLALPISSPYAPTPQLPQIVVSDVLGDDVAKNLPLSRDMAIGIPAVSKARNLLVSTVSNRPLRALRSNADGTDTDVTDQHPWLYRTNGPVSPVDRMAWTIDDLIFYGCTLWLLDRGAPDREGRRPILNAEWCPRSKWGLGRDEDGVLAILVDGMPIAEDRYMLINPPFEGLLNIGQRTLRGARDTEQAWVGRARNPIPLIELHLLDDQIDDADAKALANAWATARTQENGAVGVTPSSVELRVHGDVKAELMVEGRNAIRTDVGSFLNIRVAMLDGTIGVDSLTYSTKDGERNAFYEFDLPFWTDPIAARLSLDDIVPRGTRIRFDMYDAINLPSPTGPRVED